MGVGSAFGSWFGQSGQRGSCTGGNRVDSPIAAMSMVGTRLAWMVADSGIAIDGSGTAG
jgi:hypothetical protein